MPRGYKFRIEKALNQFRTSVYFCRMMRLQLLPLYILLFICTAQLSRAHVLFHFGFDFQVKSDDGSTEAEQHINKTITVDNNQIYVKDNSQAEPAQEPEQLISVATVGPPLMTDIWAQQHNLNGAADEKVRATRTAVAKLNDELAPVVGRSDIIAAKVKLITRYLNKADAAAAANANGSVAHKFQLMRAFVKLVDELKAPPSAAAGGERSLEYVLLQLALDKCELPKLQAEVQEQVVNAEEAWQKFVKSKLVEVTV